jgi:hypothetical protein
MNELLRRPNLLLASLALLLGTGCQSPDGRPDNTATGALAGGAFGALTGALIGGRHAGLGAAIGGLSGVVAGGLIGHAVDEQQRARLYTSSPQTLSKVEYNDRIARQQALPPPAPGSSTAPLVYTTPAASTPAPADASAPVTASAASATAAPMQALTSEDIQALAGAGVKDDVIITEIKTSNSRFSPQDVTHLQEAGVSPAVIDFIKNNAS